MIHLVACLGVLLVAPLLVMQGQPATAANPPDRGMLAVLRRDGILLPFAAFRGDNWSSPWPGDARNRELPITLEDVPDSWWGGKPPTGWHVRLANGADVNLKTQAPVTFQVFCQPRLGIKTDYRSAEPLPPAVVVPFPKDGLAVTSGVELEPIEIVDRSSSEATQLAVTLAREFQDTEDKALTGIQVDSGWKHPFKKDERQKLPVRIEAWYRSAMEQSGWTASYIEAVRAYPPRREDEGCGLETLFSGWVHQDRRQSKPKVELSAKITYCDRVGGMYMLPFGKIRLKDKQFWIFQYSGWDQEWYDVVRISPGRLTFEAEFYAGGSRGCPQPIRR